MRQRRGNRWRHHHPFPAVPRVRAANLIGELDDGMSDQARKIPLCENFRVRAWAAVSGFTASFAGASRLCPGNWRSIDFNTREEMPA